MSLKDIKLTAKNINDLKKEVSLLIDLDEFNWLKPVLESTLDEFIFLKFLNYNEIVSDYFSLNLNEHLNQVTEIINKTSKLRIEIFEIESSALILAIDMIETEKLLNIDEFIKKINIEAVVKDKINIDDFNLVKDSLKQNYKILKSKNYLKLNLLNQKGSSLNYGERLIYLREIYFDNIIEIYKRLISIKRTLKFAFNISTSPIPSFNQIDNNIDKLIWWLRTALKEYELNQQNSKQFQKSISLLNSTYSKSIDVDFLQTLKEEGSITFKIKKEDFFENETINSIRVIGFSVTIYHKNYSITESDNNSVDYARKINFEAEQEKYLYSSIISIPSQDFRLDKKEIFSLSEAETELLKKKINDIYEREKNPTVQEILIGNKEFKKDNNGNIILVKKENEKEDIKFPTKIPINDLKPIYKSSIYETLNFNTNIQFTNTNPFGYWSFQLKNDSIEKEIQEKKLANITNIVFTFKIVYN